MLFPWSMYSKDGKKEPVYVVLKNTTSADFLPDQVVTVPGEATLKDDNKYIESCVCIAESVVAPETYASARLLSAQFQGKEN